MPDGKLAAAEDDEVPCALTATAAKAITTNSLENMEAVFLLWGGSGQVGRFLCGS
jgi:hypothetical protein